VFSTDIKPTKHQRPLSLGKLINVRMKSILFIIHSELDDPVLFDDIHNDIWDKVQHDSSIGHYGMHHHKNTYQTIDSCQHHLNYKVCI